VMSASIEVMSAGRTTSFQVGGVFPEFTIVVIVDIMVAVGDIKPPLVTLTRIEYFGKQEETHKH
jgi:hypothetical protein